MTQPLQSSPSAGYILAGLCSFLFPGLGQILLNRIWGAFFCFLIGTMSWVILIVTLINTNLYFSLFLSGLLVGTVNVVCAWKAANGHRDPLSGWDVANGLSDKKGTWLEGSIFDNS